MEDPGKSSTTDPQRRQTRYRTTRRLSELKPHDFNKRLYGDEMAWNGTLKTSAPFDSVLE